MKRESLFDADDVVWASLHCPEVFFFVRGSQFVRISEAVQVTVLFFACFMMLVFQIFSHNTSYFEQKKCFCLFSLLCVRVFLCRPPFQPMRPPFCPLRQKTTARDFSE
jgi:hypothetical protein